MQHKTIKVLNFLFLISLFSFQIATCQNKTEIDSSSSFNTILFKVTSTNHKNVSYLFGTHHAFGKTFFDSLTKANQALKSCDVLIKENLNIPGKMAEDIINKRTTEVKWNKFLDKENLAYVEDLFANSPTDYKKMTPTEMYTFLNRYFKQQICLNKNANDTSLSLDDYISSKATEQDIALYGLETTEEQIELINKDVEGMPRRSHKRRLANIINKIRTENSNSCEEIDWYSQMQIDYKLDTTCTNTLILTDRNNKWMTSISNMLKQKNCFIAVGLSHLMFDCGLISQLKKLGYTITPIEVK